MNSNIKKYYIWKCFSLNVFITPIYVIYLREMGLSYLQISTLHLVRDLAIVFLEVPTGILADFIKRKTVLMLSAPCLFLSMLIFALTPNYYMLMLSFFLWAVAIALASGTGDAFAYENVEDKKKFSVVTSNTDVIRRVGSIVTKMGGPVLYSISKSLPFFGSAFIGVSAFFVASSFKEEKASHEKLSKRKYIKDMASQLKSKEVLLAIISYSLMLGVLTTIFRFQQSRLDQLGVNAIYLSLIYGGFFVVGSVGSFFARHLNKWLKYEYLSALVAFAGAISIVIMGLSNSVILVTSVMMFQSLIHGVLFPTQSMYINSFLQDSNRSGILSLQSLTWGGMSAGITMLSGALADWLGLGVAIAYMAVFPGLLTIFWIVWSLVTLKDDSVREV